MKTKFAVAVASLAIALSASAATVNYFWNNSSTDMNSASSYSRVDTGEVSTVMPDSDDLVWFDGLPVKQPYLSENLTLHGIRFASTNDVSNSKFYASTDDGLNGYNHCGWVISGAPGVVLTLTRSANLGQSETNQGLLNHCSYGTNRIECAVHVSNAAKIIANCGHLVLAGPISQVENGTTLLMEAGGANAALVLAAANPDFKGILNIQNGHLEIAHPDALCGIKRVDLTSSNGSGTARYFRNVTGGELVCDHPFQFWMNKCEATVFDGPPMRFPAATLCPDSGQNHTIWVNDSLTIGSVSNRNTGTTGIVGALDYYGPGSLHILEGFCEFAPETRTNVLRSLGGTVVLHKQGELARIPVAVGVNGTNSRRPRLGLVGNTSHRTGLVPGGWVVWGNNCNYGGWAAYGGDYTVTMEALTDGILKLHGWKGDTTGLSANLNWNGTDWWLLPEKFFFGAPDADGTVTLEGDVDVNMADSNAHFYVYAYQGGAFVAGRFAGSVTNAYGTGWLGRKIMKTEGDGAVAFDGPVYLTGQHTVSAGGLLFNNPVTQGSVSASDTGWLGGTGTVHAVTVGSGGAFRPGEQGGTLTSDGAVTMADGSKFIVDVDDNVHGCLKLTGSSVALKANGTITVVPMLVEELTGGRTVKILDWQYASPTTQTLLDIANWTVDADTNVFSRASLSTDGTAMYLYVRPKFKPGFFLMVR